MTTEELYQSILKHKDYFMRETLTTELRLGGSTDKCDFVGEYEFKGLKIKIGITKVRECPTVE